MELGSVRPVIAGVTVPAPRADIDRGAVATELSAREVVTPVEKMDPAASIDERRRPVQSGEAGQRDRGARTTASDTSFERTIVEDERSDTLVYKKIDLQTGDIVQQIPEESLLRMRAIMASWGEAPMPARNAAYDLTA
jgi:hypothetical protein